MCYYDFKSSVYHIYMVIRSVAICWRPPMWPTRWPELLPAPTAVWTPSSTSWLGRTSAVTSPRRASCLNWKKQMWATVWQRSSDAIPQTTLAKNARGCGDKSCASCRSPPVDARLRASFKRAINVCLAKKQDFWGLDSPYEGGSVKLKPEKRFT